jgi:hypothetical protein
VWQKFADIVYVAIVDAQIAATSAGRLAQFNAVAGRSFRFSFSLKCLALFAQALGQVLDAVTLRNTITPFCQTPRGRARPIPMIVSMFLSPGSQRNAVSL